MRDFYVTELTEAEIEELAQEHLPELSDDDLCEVFSCAYDENCSCYVGSIPVVPWGDKDNPSPEYVEQVIKPLHESNGTMAMLLTELMRLGFLNRNHYLIKALPFPFVFDTCMG